MPRCVRFGPGWRRLPNLVHELGLSAESQSKVPEIKTDKIGAVGGAPWGGEVLPLSPYVYYNYDISFPMVTTTVMQKAWTS